MSDGGHHHLGPGPADQAGGASGAPWPGAAPVSAAPPGWYPVPDGRTLWWDGYQWHEQPMPVEAPSPYRTVSAAAVFAQAALGAIAVGSVLLTWAHLQRRQAAIEFGERFDLASATALDDAETVVGLLSIGYVLAFIGAAIAIPILCFRIHANLHGPLQARGLEYRPGWAAGWWFVPLANLVMPYRVVKEAWRASDPSIPAGTTTWRSTDPPKLLSWWWAGFVISGLIGRFSYTELDADGNVTASSVEFSATVAAFGSALTVVAALLAIMVFRQVTQRHLARARMLGIAE